ncbi:variant surface glycoprotein (VSG, atypical), putative [Trypanosoma equiperdum]|uniref:Variant surface glycoprotein (VSG, atypical), putative n=1 Tax=Trypanosoma equiperdum TaxID=5694 RepID=A0A1G4I7L4_TRYEQ|nr:variant surface glycoprotein (VSG, atypical), putative [Trypanosoma equiperdum]
MAPGQQYVCGKLVLLLTWIVHTGSSKTSTAIKNPCQEAAFNTKVIRTLKRRIEAVETSTKSLEKEAAALNLAACISSEKVFSTAATLLAGICRNRISEARTQNAANTQTLMKSISTLEKRNAQLMAAIAFAKSGKFTVTHSADNAGGKTNLIGTGSSKTCSVSITHAPANEHSCPDTPEDDADLEADINDLQKLETYNTVPDSAFSLSGITADVGSKGDYGSATIVTHNDGIACVRSGDDSATLSGITVGIVVKNIGRASPWAQPTATKIGGSPASSPCQQEDSIDKKAFVTSKQAAYAICTARSIALNTPAPLSTQTLDSLQGAADVKETVVLVTNGPTEKLPDDNAQKEAVKLLIGEGKTTVHDKFLKDLEANKLDFKIGSKHIKKGIVSISDTEDYARATSFCLGLQYRTAKMQKKEASPVPATAEKTKHCKGETDKEKCDNKDGCEYENGECKAKEEVKAENNGKTTNTTGNNSFLINKAPLWLAFLLL